MSARNALAFYNSPLLHTVIFPSTLTQIEKGAFADCLRLTKVTFPSESVSVDATAFSAAIWEHSDAAVALGLGFTAPISDCGVESTESTEATESLQ